MNLTDCWIYYPPSDPADKSLVTVLLSTAEGRFPFIGNIIYHIPAFSHKEMDPDLKSTCFCYNYNPNIKAYSVRKTRILEPSQL